MVEKCPKCGGRLFVEFTKKFKDTYCLTCGYRRTTPKALGSFDRPIKKLKGFL